MELIFLGTGLLVGGLSIWFISRLYFLNKHGDNGHIQELQVEYKLVAEKLRASEEQANHREGELKQKQKEIIQLSNQNSALEANQKNLRERMAENQEEVKQLQKN